MFFLTVVKITCRIRNLNTSMAWVLLVVVAVPSSPTRKHRFVARAPDLEKTVFSACAIYFRAMFCIVSLVNCVLFTHIMKWERTHLKKPHCCWNYLIFLPIFSRSFFLILVSSFCYSSSVWWSHTFLGRKVKTVRSSSVITIIWHWASLWNGLFFWEMNLPGGQSFFFSHWKTKTLGIKSVMAWAINHISSLGSRVKLDFAITTLICMPK